MHENLVILVWNYIEPNHPLPGRGEHGTNYPHPNQHCLPVLDFR
jgi:hypothetical protein